MVAVFTVGRLRRCCVVKRGRRDSYVVELVMTEEGRRRMKELSSRNLGRRLAIVLDDDIVALATVSHPIDSDALNLPTMPDSATAEKVSVQIKRVVEGI
jgi:preprotein translocase subunit SecD